MRKVKRDLGKHIEQEKVHFVTSEYERRKAERMSIEAQWQLNSCFVAGRQHTFVNPLCQVDESYKEFEWQERQTYNHIAPIYESRLAKLDRVRPIMAVRPAGSSDKDVKVAKMSSKILNAVSSNIDLTSIITDATMWSELTGSVFYKLVWEVGRSGVGDIKVVVVPPYEVYPDNLSASDVSSLRSLVHARAVPCDEVEMLYGVKVEQENVQIATVMRNGVTMSPDLNISQPKGYVNLIEMYIAPNEQKPNGQLIIVCGGKLLYDGELPYNIGDDGEKVLPFVKQDSIAVAGSFFGTCMIDRIIPVQRALNAVKNRKHEYMNRLAVGVLAVEDGSVDTEDLEINGLMPGKVMVYRQGSTPPQMLDMGSVPTIFTTEEERLQAEFSTITGVSEMMRSSSVPNSVTSGTALQLLSEQDDTRLTITAELIRKAIRLIARFVIRMFKQFVRGSRINYYAGEDGSVELLSWKGSDLGEGDIIFETDNELNNTRAVKQTMLFDLLKLGLFNGDDGKLSDAVRNKILSVVGYGSWETLQSQENLHLVRAEKENDEIMEGMSAQVAEIDDHALHISTHTRYMLSAYDQDGNSPVFNEQLLEHIRQHKLMESMTTVSESNGGGL